MKGISVMGSTGSIGTQTLDVVRNNRDLKVTALAAGSNTALLKEQIEEFRPSLVCVFDEKKAKELSLACRHLPVKITAGMEGLIECAVQKEADTVVAAIVGMIGIVPVIEAIKAGKEIALANKETLVTAGHIIMPLAEEYRVPVLPVDSEHSAIFQVLHGENRKEISRILLTASGGPFRGRSREELREIRVEDALKHPTWSMGRKITIDSSTMVNKGLEVMEAKWLFGVEYDQIQVVVQPQSVIHSMVEFCDGGVLAQLGVPDMRLPIQYALFYPQRRRLPGDRLDFGRLRELTFEEPDLETFEGLALAYEAGRTGGSMPTIYNAANEYAVERFLNREIGYLDITRCIRTAMERHKVIQNPSVAQILEAEQEACSVVKGLEMK